jgi:polyribonucleotide nucleotidyltransferase
LTDLREKLKTTIASVDELDAAYGKARLASKLGCNASDLKYQSMDVSSEKIGRVIGKNGATIKQVEAERKVVLDVNSVSGTIHFTGSEAAIQLAMADIEKICKAVDVDVKVPEEVVAYFTTKVCFKSSAILSGSDL